MKISLNIPDAAYKELLKKVEKKQLDNPKYTMSDLIREYIDANISYIVEDNFDSDSDSIELYDKDIFTFISENTNIVLRDYQKEILENIINNKYIAIANSRQIGLTTLYALYILWYGISNKDKTIVYTTTKKDLFLELKNKIVKIILEKNILKNYFTHNNNSQLIFKTGSRLVSMSDRSIAAGFQIDVYIASEVSFYKNVSEIFRNIFPTVSSTLNSKFIISSNPKRGSWFNEFFNNRSNTSFIRLKYPYNVVSGRDLNWLTQQLKCLGQPSSHDDIINLLIQNNSDDNFKTKEELYDILDMYILHSLNITDEDSDEDPSLII